MFLFKQKEQGGWFQSLVVTVQEVRYTLDQSPCCGSIYFKVMFKFEHLVMSRLTKYVTTYGFKVAVISMFVIKINAFLER